MNSCFLVFVFVFEKSGSVLRKFSFLLILGSEHAQINYIVFMLMHPQVGEARKDDVAEMKPDIPTAV